MEKEFYIFINGEKLSVDEEVYRAYYQPEWAEKKRKSREQRCRNADGSRCNGNCHNCVSESDNGVLSLDLLAEDGYEPADETDIQEIVADKLLMDELHKALAELTEDERALIDALFFQEKSERTVAAERHVQQNTITYHKKKILNKLKMNIKQF